MPARGAAAPPPSERRLAASRAAASRATRALRRDCEASGPGALGGFGLARSAASARGSGTVGAGTSVGRAASASVGSGERASTGSVCGDATAGAFAPSSARNSR